MSYKRLTKKAGWHKDIDLTQELGYSYIYQRLSELENKIEQGTLIELPCKVGDTVYALVHNYKIEEMIVYGFEFNCHGYVLNTKGDKGNIHYHYDLYEKTLNIDWFFTKAEAEKKLKELKGND